MRSRRKIAVIAVVAIALIVTTGIVLLRDTSSPPMTAPPRTTVLNERTRNDLVRRACSLSPQILVRIWRGFAPAHSPDVTFVPRKPNYWGSFTRVSHTGPWDYLQEVPLVFYGPGRITASDEPLTDPANITDVYATLGEILDVELPSRTSQVLDSAIADNDAKPPKLVVVVVWDGVGRGVLERWPNRWPNLARLEREGTSYLNATVGSSPSVTPATHSSLGTGAFPREHKVVTIEYRGADGEMHNAFEKSNPRQLKLTTFGDEIDQRNDNQSIVGMLGWSVGGSPVEGPGAWTTNHLGMLGGGRTVDGGDADEEVLIGDTGNITGNPKFYSFPGYLEDFGGLEEHAEELDREDGKADGLWLGHDILGAHDNPAWVGYQLDVLTRMIRRSGYGLDDTTDVLLTNFKMTDIAGHTYSADSREIAETLEAQDEALGELLDVLDARVRDYALVVTADHGHTPDPLKTGAWPIDPEELIADIERYFEIPEGSSLVEGSEPVGLYLDRAVVRSTNVDAVDVAKFLSDYTIRENWPAGEQLPEGYRKRGSERVMSAAFADEQLPDVMKCKFGSETPPPDLDA